MTGEVRIRERRLGPQEVTVTNRFTEFLTPLCALLIIFAVCFLGTLLKLTLILRNGVAVCECLSYTRIACGFGHGECRFRLLDLMNYVAVSCLYGRDGIAAMPGCVRWKTLLRNVAAANSFETFCSVADCWPISQQSLS